MAHVKEKFSHEKARENTKIKREGRFFFFVPFCGNKKFPGIGLICSVALVSLSAGAASSLKCLTVKFYSCVVATLKFAKTEKRVFEHVVTCLFLDY